MQQDRINEILAELKSNLKRLSICNLSNEPGIYAIGVISSQRISLISAQVDIKLNEIIYIGKTESSQIARDLKTHFNSGKSGSSTLRRSLGAILKELNLTPIPRSCKEKSTKRFTNYRFTEDGEKELTKWMEDNLSLSYWEHNKSLSLGEIEEEIIKAICPILNLQNNPKNKWKTEIKRLRKDCRGAAEKNKNLCK